jgi:hypothetical protein
VRGNISIPLSSRHIFQRKKEMKTSMMANRIHGDRRAVAIAVAIFGKSAVSYM